MTRSAREVLEQEFLQVRAKTLEIAAFFDRLHAAEVSDIDHSQLDLLEQGCRILSDDKHDKAARVQLLFSRAYEADWREKFSL